METKYKIEVSIPQIKTIIDALHQQNYLIRCEVMNELSKQAISQSDFNKNLQEIMDSSISYQLENEMIELINSIYEVAV